MSAADRLTEIEGRAAAATAGPWSHGIDTHGDPSDGPTYCEVFAVDGPVAELDYSKSGDEDATFIAHSRTDVPALASALRAVLSLHSEYRTPLTGRISCCAGCNLAYPCPTTKVIAIALTSEETS